MTAIHEGGCLCGSVRYRTVGDPIMATICHCKFCQRRTGSAFSEPVFFKMEQIEFSGGPRSTYEHRLHAGFLSRREQESAFTLLERGKCQVHRPGIGPSNCVTPRRLAKPVAMA